jgi:predicted homoserine dehydrogenase-like protein
LSCCALVFASTHRIHPPTQGPGPLYTFYTPYHLCHVEVPLTCARAVLFKDAACTPCGPPVGDVVAVAKTDLGAGARLDAIGGYTCYGIAEDALVARQQSLLPLGLAPGCVLVRDVIMDAVITWADVLMPAGRLCDKLWQQQNELFGLPQPQINVTAQNDGGAAAANGDNTSVAAAEP